MTMTSTRAIVAALVIGLMLVLVGQAVAGALLPAQDGSAAQVAGRAGFAYLTGVRTFAAAVLWNRLEPIFHEYYSEVPLGEQLSVVPMVRMVNWLDPQFEDGYYLSAWVLFQRGDVEQAYEIASSGVDNNPDSGLLKMSYGQILLLNGDIEEAAVLAEGAYYADWRDDEERFGGLRVLMTIFHQAGMSELHDAAAHEHAELQESFGLPSESTGVEHDHDGDGVPDH